MKKINSVNFQPFKNNEHGQFHQVIRDALSATPAVKTIVSKFYQSYVDAVVAELLAIDVEQGSQHTGPIEEADLFRDRLYRSFVLQNHSSLLSFDPAVQEAANRILRIINQVGDMRKEPYNQESETLTSLINQLENNYAADIKLCNSELHLSKLKEANNSFITNFGTRSTEASLRISGDVRIARAVTDPIFKNICSVINAMVLLDGEEVFSDFIDKVNYEIDYYTNTINKRSSSGKDDEKNKDKNKDKKDDKDNPVTPS